MWTKILSGIVFVVALSLSSCSYSVVAQEATLSTTTEETTLSTQDAMLLEIEFLKIKILLREISNYLAGSECRSSVFESSFRARINQRISRITELMETHKNNSKVYNSLKEMKKDLGNIESCNTAGPKIVA